MYMKTNKNRTKCAPKIGYFCLGFGHLRLTSTCIAENRAFLTTIWRFNGQFPNSNVAPPLRAAHAGLKPGSTSTCYATLFSQDWMACDTLWYFGEAHRDTRNPSN